MEAIETATLNDIPELAQPQDLLFTQEADFGPDRQKQKRGLRLIIESVQIGVIFVARNRNEVVGVVSLLFTISTAEGGPVCWLEDIVIRPDRRGDGIGTRLVWHIIDYASCRGFSRITLLTDTVNAGAIRMYERYGFVEPAMTAFRLDLQPA